MNQYLFKLVGKRPFKALKDPNTKTCCLLEAAINCILRVEHFLKIPEAYDLSNVRSVAK